MFVLVLFVHVQIMIKDVVLAGVLVLQCCLLLCVFFALKSTEIIQKSQRYIGGATVLAQSPSRR